MVVLTKDLSVTEMTNGLKDQAVPIVVKACLICYGHHGDRDVRFYFKVSNYCIRHHGISTMMYFVRLTPPWEI